MNTNSTELSTHGSTSLRDVTERFFLPEFWLKSAAIFKKKKSLAARHCGNLNTLLIECR